MLARTGRGDLFMLPRRESRKCVPARALANTMPFGKPRAIRIAVCQQGEFGGGSVGKGRLVGERCHNIGDLLFVRRFEMAIWSEWR